MIFRLVDVQAKTVNAISSQAEPDALEDLSSLAKSVRSAEQPMALGMPEFVDGLRERIGVNNGY